MSEQINDARRMADLFKGFSGGYGTYDARFLGKAEQFSKLEGHYVSSQIHPAHFQLFPINFHVMRCFGGFGGKHNRAD